MRQAEPIDEYTLAAFLAGTLAPERRAEVAAYLAGNAEARELLCMAFDAYEASGLPGGEAGTPPRRTTPAAPATHRPDRTPQRPRIWHRLPRYAAAAVLVIALGGGVRLLLGPPDDALRYRQATEEVVLEISVAPGGLAVRWNPVPGADHYQLVVFDKSQGRPIDRFQTSDYDLVEGSDVIRQLRARLRSGNTYTLRVDAFDSQNRQLQRSNLVDFTLR